MPGKAVQNGRAQRIRGQAERPHQQQQRRSSQDASARMLPSRAAGRRPVSPFVVELERVLEVAPGAKFAIGAVDFGGAARVATPRSG